MAYLPVKAGFLKPNQFATNEFTPSHPTNTFHAFTTLIKNKEFKGGLVSNISKKDYVLFLFLNQSSKR
jgi:hypothetical protein